MTASFCSDIDNIMLDNGTSFAVRIDAFFPITVSCKPQTLHPRASFFDTCVISAYDISLCYDCNPFCERG